MLAPSSSLRPLRLCPAVAQVVRPRFYLPPPVPRSSYLAAAAVYVAMKTLGKGEWNEVMVAHTRYTESELAPCAHAMARLQRQSATASLSAVHKQYSNPKFMEVARLPAPSGLGEEN